MVIQFSMNRLDRGPYTKLTFTIMSTHEGDNKATEPINIQDLALVKLKFIKIGNLIQPSISQKKNEIKDHHSKIEMKIACGQFQKCLICSDDWGTDIIMERVKYDAYVKPQNIDIVHYWIQINITTRDITPVSLLASIKLYNDTEFTDFQLHATDGYVAVHKALLTVHSDMFKTMLKGEWKETEEGRINIDGITVQTLQNLKSYMYLGTLPDEGLEELLLVAVRYLMTKLETDCIAKLVDKATADNLDALIDFAFQNNLQDLVKGLILQIPDNISHVYSMKKSDQGPKEE